MCSGRKIYGNYGWWGGPEENRVRGLAMRWRVEGRAFPYLAASLRSNFKCNRLTGICPFVELETSCEDGTIAKEKASTSRRVR